ncbi:WD40 repeat-like protein [Athelia psychrophila]|uniref:WD40 repeat-like protein n=1 Tax=Athelia psychrophila TaxID=1759441 RepID=A0A166RJW0_9AGAM|nr:WD40 repeat-like protein [Fibularhizoctonia sp. CBS 109695]
MLQTGLIQSAHSDLVTNACYDFYGLCLATCSLDQRIKIWQLDETNGTWNVEDDWKAHDAAVSRVCWAHPEFGAVIASSSFDRTVKIWERTSAGAHETNTQINGSAPANSRWKERAFLHDARGTVRAVEFAPHHFGLKLASISTDNHLRVYECLEQPSLATWQLAEEVDLLNLPSTTSPAFGGLALATPTQTSATLDGAAATLAAQTQQLNQMNQMTQMNQMAQMNQMNMTQSANPLARPGLGNREADGGWCISWCKDRYWGEIIAAGCGISGIVQIISLSSSRRPTAILVLDPAPTDESSLPLVPAATAAPNAAAGGDTESTVGVYAVTSVAWAPSCGRSYHLIATGSRDGHVRIWKVKPVEDDAEEGEGDGKWSASIVADFDNHKSAVGSVEWNITGTVLSSAGNDGRIRLWKATSGNVWRPAGSIGVEETEESHDADVDMDENAGRS